MRGGLFVQLSCTFGLVLAAVAQEGNTPASLMLACDRAAASPADVGRRVGGPGVTLSALDAKTAIAACEAAATAAPNDAQTIFQLGRGYYVDKSYEAARAHFAKASESGYAIAQSALGSFYSTGFAGLAKDEREVLRLFRLAAEQGDPNGNSSLGIFSELGRLGLAKNDQAAATYYKRSADAGNATGQSNLGRFYLGGRGGLPQSDEEAERLFRLSSDQGDVFAHGYLGFLYETGRGGLQQNDAEAARLYRLAADHGEPWAQNKLAIFYEEGRGGLPKDSNEAARLYQLVAKQDSNLVMKRQASKSLMRLGLVSPVPSSTGPLGEAQARPVIGFLNTTAPSADRSTLNAFRAALKDAGYIEGQSLTIDYRWATDPREMYELAADMVRRRVDIIVANGSSLAAEAAIAATDKIPIVIVGGADPVQSGLVASLNRPGGNVTGMTTIVNQLAGKRLSLLLDIVPNATAIGYLINFGRGADADTDTRALLEAARSVGREVIVFECRTSADFDAAFSEFAKRQIGGLVVGAFPVAYNNRNKVVALAAQYKIPTIYAQAAYATQGGLMSYTGLGNMRDVVNQYVVRILKGEKPASLQVQLPTKFQLILNLKTAKTLGLTVPPTLLVAADRVIE